MARTGVGDVDHCSGHSSDCLRSRYRWRSHGFQDPGNFWDP